MDTEYKILLGTELNSGDLENIKTQLNNIKVDSIKINIDTNNFDSKIKSIRKEIEELNKSQGSSINKSFIAISSTDIQSLNKQFESLVTSIDEIKSSLGSLNKESGMKSLLETVNELSNKLSGITSQFEALSKTMSGMNFNMSFNFGSSKNPIAAATEYGTKARGTIPLLKQQAKAIGEYIGKSEFYVKKYGRIAADWREANAQFFTMLSSSKGIDPVKFIGSLGDSSKSLKQQMETWQTYINIIQESAKLKGIDLSGVTSQFSKSSDQLVQDTQKILTGEQNLEQQSEESMNKLKSIFGSSIDAEKLTQQLDSIIRNLEDINRTVSNLSSNVSIEGLADAFNNLSTTIQNLVQNCSNARSSLTNDFGGIEETANQAANAIQGSVERTANAINNISLKIPEDQINNLRDALGSNGFGFNDSSIQAIIKDLESLDITIDKIKTSFDSENNTIRITVTGTDQLGRVVNAIREVQQEVNAATPTIKNLGTTVDQNFSKIREQANAIKESFSDGTINKQIENIKISFESLRNATDDTKKSYNDFINASNNLKSAYEDGDINKLIQANEAYEQALKKVKNQLEINEKQEKQSYDTAKLEAAKSTLASKMDIWLKSNSAATKKFGSEIEELKRKLQSCDATQLSGIKAEFEDLKRRAKEAGVATESFSDMVKRKLGSVGSYVSASMIIGKSIQTIKEMYNNVVEVDTAMTELYRVTDLTSSQYATLYDNMTESAKRYGVALSDIITSTADWVRLGFDSNTANRLAEITTMYQHISDLDNDTAVENLVTAYKGFQDQLLNLYNGDSAKAVEYVADIFNELGNKYAVSAEEVGEALTKCASALELAGNSIQESSAMATGIAEVTQDAEKAGSSLKVLSLRLRGMKGELQDLGEEVDDNVESISKMQTQILNLTNGKVNIFNDDGSFKSTYEIMQGIAEIYDQLSSTQQADLLETIAGKISCQSVQKCA